MKQPDIIGFTFAPCPSCGVERYTSNMDVPCMACTSKAKEDAPCLKPTNKAK